MISFRTILLAAAVALASATPGGAQEETTVVETHGDWEVRCTPDKSRCTMQQAFSSSDGRPLALMSLARLQGRATPDGVAIPAQMEVRVPLGVLLTEGLSIQIDSKKKEVAPYSFCTQGGCRVLTPLPESFIAVLKAGASAKLEFKSIDGKTQTATISLTGFTKAFNTLTPLG